MPGDVPSQSAAKGPSEDVVAADDASNANSSLRARFARGVLWAGVAMVLGKIVSFLSQYILGRMFDKEVYGLFAMAITAATIGDVFASGGIRTVIIARGAEAYRSIARTAAAVAHAFSLGAALLVAATAPFWAYYYYGQPSVMWLLLILALSLAMSSMGLVQRAHLATELRGGALAILDSMSAVVRHSAVVLLAWLGFREYSFVWPLVLVNLWLYIAALMMVGRLPQSRLDWSLAKSLLHEGKWVLIAGIGATIIARGDYFVGGGFARYDEKWLGLIGLYFFGYQLTHSLYGLFNISLNSVMQPAFAKLRSNPERQADVYLTVLRITVFLATPFTIVGMLSAPLLVRMLWPDGKWDDTIPVIQLLALTEAVRQLHFISVALLSARGQFRAAANLTIIDGVTTVLAALIGCLSGELLSLTIAVATQRTVMSIIEAAWVYRHIGGEAWRVLWEVLKPLAPAVLIGLALYVPITLHAGSQGVLAAMWMALAAIPFVVAYAILGRTLLSRSFDESAELLQRVLPILQRWKRKQPVPGEGSNQ